MISTAVRKANEPGRVHARGARRAAAGRPEASGEGEPLPAPVASRPATVFRRGSEVCHSRCGRPLEFHGRRAGLELDFFCRRCMEHVTLPECLVSRIPVVEDVARTAGSALAAPGGEGRPGTRG